MNNDLVYAADVWKSWSSLTEGERKLRAARAIQQGDHHDLWLMTLAYLQFKGRKGTNISAHTLRAYRRGVVDYLIYTGGSDILRVSADEAQTYVRVLEQGSDEVKPKSPATGQLRAVAARRFYQALAWCGFELGNPFEKVMIRPDPVKPFEKRSEYGLDTVKELVHACDTYDDPVSKVAILLAVLSGLRIEEIATLERVSEGPTLLIILLGAHAGLRVSEMTALRWEHIDLGAGVLRVVAGKGGKTAKVYLTPTLSRALEATPPEQRTGYVLPCRNRRAVYQRLEAACRQARVTFKGVHALRHASGTRLRAETGDLALTADHLRHSSLDTARGYAKANNVQLKKALGEW